MDVETVFVETSVILASSIRCMKPDIDIEVEHDGYSQSKGLINYRKKDKIRLITTSTSQKEAKDNLEKAIKDELQRKEEEIRKNPKLQDAYKDMVDLIERRFNNHIESITREGTVPDKVKEIQNKEVVPLYNELSQASWDRPRKVWSHPKRYKNLAKELDRKQMKRYGKNKKRLKQKGVAPDINDLKILSEAIHIKRREQISSFYFASLDKHFIGDEAPYKKIPPKIEEEFSIVCLPPERIFQKIEQK